jgi:hypothetical protein
MNPDELRSRLRAKLIQLGSSSPRNLSDLVVFQETAARTRATVRTADRRRPAEVRHLEFRNGSRLRISVVLVQTANGWDVTQYQFHFERASGRYFRYDLDRDADRGMEHPLAHLHVDSEEPRYPTHPQDLVALVDFLQRQGLV